MDAAPSLEAVAKALRKILAAVEGMGHKAVAVGAMADQAWGSRRAARRVELLLASGESQREAILGAARGEGLRQAPGGTPLNLEYADPKLGGSVPVDLMEAAGAFQRQIIARAQRAAVLQTPMLVATCEDLILLRAGSALPADRESVIELLKVAAARIDAPYLKREAEAAGTFGPLKAAWQEARQG
jgi:hypothetical protein